MSTSTTPSTISTAVQDVTTTTTTRDGDDAVTAATPPPPLLLLLQQHSLTTTESEQAIDRFCQLLRFPTVSSLAATDGTYVRCAQWIYDTCQQIPVLQVERLPEAPDHSPVIVAIWKGVDPSLPILLLNSHYDVVPASESDWSVPPFAGIRTSHANNTTTTAKIYGRGTQDMKSVTVQYLEAIRKIHQLYPQYQPQRSIYLSFVPDEEVGGGGMAAFLESQLYRSLPAGIALALDEGLANPSDAFSIFYGERLPWWVDVTATGPTGHGSRFIEHTAVEQLIALANRALEFRRGQKSLLGMSEQENCTHAVAAANRNKRDSGHAANHNQTTLGDVTSLNITTLQAGVQVGDTYAYNCVPPVAKCSLDIRISPHTPPSDISNMLDQWCRECSSTGGGTSDDNSNNNSESTNGTVTTPTLSWNYIGGHGNDLQTHALTSTDSKQNPWYAVFESAIASMGIALEPQVFPAATDSRFLRALGIKAFGFSPMRNTEILLHENDECLPERAFLEGIAVYVTLIMALGSQGKEIDNVTIGNGV